ncbi:ankyrin repeat-containing domain protein [Absidia repens]|uniref:Ankyrin repeat-containing domain protein n=1 Tax=Absidia repens TaxID=90262 RepID=A0A1X2IP11_9FUNG|nr:ankyrin repeat-containing domain protein [Absidia repens]
MAANQELIEDLIYCARYGELEDLKQSNAAPELYVTKDDDGNTALHMASANNHIGKNKKNRIRKSFFYLGTIEKLGDEQLRGLVNVQNGQGNTPLHWAALNGHLEVVKALVSNGGDCKIKNVVEKTPIYEAQQRSHEKIAEFFLDTMIEEAKEESDDEMDEDEQYVETGVPKTDDAMKE